MSAYDNEDLSKQTPPLPPKLRQTAPPLPPKLNYDKKDTILKTNQGEKIFKKVPKMKQISPKPRSNRNIIVQNEGYRFVKQHHSDFDCSVKDPDVIYENRKNIVTSTVNIENENKPKSLLSRMKSLFKKKQLKKVKKFNDDEYFASHQSASSVLPCNINGFNERSDELIACSNINRSRYAVTDNDCPCRLKAVLQHHCHFRCIPVCRQCYEQEHVSRFNSRVHNFSNVNQCVNCQPCICNTQFHSCAPSFSHFSSTTARSWSVQSNHDRQSSGIDLLESIDSITDSRLLAIPKAVFPADQLPVQNTDPLTMSLHKNLQLLRKVGWYWGPLRSDEAEEIMVDRCDGTFIVRDSSHADYLFSITFRVNNNTHHTRIQFSQNKFWLTQEDDGNGFKTVIDLIDSNVRESQNGKFRYFQNIDDPSLPTYAVILLYPLSRFRIMTSLKHIARFVIVSHVRSDHLDQLPLPEYLISYLQDKDHHYVENFYHYVNIMKVTDR